jgi:hypothetical protein
MGGSSRNLAFEFGFFAAAVAAGFGVLPALIYAAGSALLGPYEGSSLATTYGSIYRGLVSGSVASWTVVLGPCLLYLLYRGLRVCWRLGT